MTLSELSEMMDVNLEVKYLPKRENRKWICRFDNTEVKGDGVLIGKYGDGDSPDEAINDYATSIAGKTIVLNAYGNRKEFKVPASLGT